MSAGEQRALMAAVLLQCEESTKWNATTRAHAGAMSLALVAAARGTGSSYLDEAVAAAQRALDALAAAAVALPQVKGFAELYAEQL